MHGATGQVIFLLLFVMALIVYNLYGTLSFLPLLGSNSGTLTFLFIKLSVL